MSNKIERPSLSACLIVRDESRYLARCLRSLRDVVNEIVVADTGSTDESMDIAREHGARVIEIDWYNDFAKARNAALDHISGDWVLVLDADEELATTKPKVLHELLCNPEAEAYEIILQNILPADSLQRVETARITRLFRLRPEYRYRGAVHEQIRPSIEQAGGAVLPSSLKLYHYGYLSERVQNQDRRAQRNRRILEKGISTNPDDIQVIYHYAKMLKAEGRYKLAITYFKRWVEQGGCGQLNPLAVSRGLTAYAQCLLALDEYAGAKQLAELALKYSSTNADARYVMTVCCVFLGKNQTAQGHLEFLLADPNVNAEQLTTLRNIVN